MRVGDAPTCEVVMHWTERMTGGFPSPLLRVAVVDDHPVVRAGIVAMLKRSGTCRVVAEAGAARLALQLLPKARPEIVLVDMKLPDCSGAAFIRELGERLPESKLLVLTAYEEVGMAREALKLGARGYLLKGAPADEVLLAISQVAAGQCVIDPVLAGHLWELSAQPSRPTAREIEILTLLAAGRTNKEVAGVLRVSEDTVKFHLKNLFRRLKAKSRTEAVVAATRLGYLELNT